MTELLPRPTHTRELIPSSRQPWGGCFVIIHFTHEAQVLLSDKPCFGHYAFHPKV